MRWFKAALTWIVGQAINNWPAIVVIAGGSLMGYLAAISDWLASYGPVAWGGVGLISIGVMVGIYFLYGVAKSRVALADYTKGKTIAVSTNVRASTHREEKLNLIDFYHPFFEALENVRFDDCDLFGPASIIIEGGTFLRCAFIDCELVIVRSDRPVKGATVFRHSTFDRCKLYRITFLMNLPAYHANPEMRKHMPVISDGRAGDI
jgi:hypothetical protein